MYCQGKLDRFNSSMVYRKTYFSSVLFLMTKELLGCHMILDSCWECEKSDSTLLIGSKLDGIDEKNLIIAQIFDSQ